MYNFTCILILICHIRFVIFYSSLLVSSSPWWDALISLRYDWIPSYLIKWPDFTLFLILDIMSSVLLTVRTIQISCSLQIGWTSLLHSASHNHVDVVRALLERGADIEAKNNVCSGTCKSEWVWVCVCGCVFILLSKISMISFFNTLCAV